MFRIKLLEDLLRITVFVLELQFVDGLVSRYRSLVETVVGVVQEVQLLRVAL